MEAQSTYANETRTDKKIFRRLFQIQIELEQFGINQPIYFEKTQEIIQAIDQIFERVIENNDGQDDS